MADKRATTAAYALLGLLAVQPWTGYELTQQAQRSLRFIWPTSAAHLYREQKRLVALGWATATTEAVGRRQRTRYAITRAGRAALKAWAGTDPAEPAIEVEGVVRAFFGDMAGVDVLEASMRSTATQARASIEEMLSFVDDYLETGGPFPHRLHVIAIVVEVITEVMGALEEAFSRTADEVAAWDTTVGRGLDIETRERLERILARHRRQPPSVSNT
jgi:DNA-binding PadR family transcriptional regulator